jgi:hypothetical protein
MIEYSPNDWSSSNGDSGAAIESSYRVFLNCQEIMMYTNNFLDNNESTVESIVIPEF